MVVVIVCSGCKNVFLLLISYNFWEVIKLLIEVILFDIEFIDSFEYGWIVGFDVIFFEINDSGKIW